MVRRSKEAADACAGLNNLGTSTRALPGNRPGRDLLPACLSEPGCIGCVARKGGMIGGMFARRCARNLCRMGQLGQGKRLLTTDGHGSASARSYGATSRTSGARGRGWRRGVGNGRRGCGTRGRWRGRARFSFSWVFFGCFACHPVWGDKTCGRGYKTCGRLEGWG